MAGQGTPATALLRQQKITFTLHEYPHDPRVISGTHQGHGGYGYEAATALGLDPARCFKTLVADVDGVLTVAVVPVSGSLDLKALAGALGGKRAVMAEPAVAQRSTGYVLGGISPLAQRTRLRTVIDESTRQWPTIYVSAGRRGLEIELAPDDLARLTDGRFAAVASDR